MKPILTTVCCILLTLSLLACGNDDSTEQQTMSQSTSIAASTGYEKGVIQASGILNEQGITIHQYGTHTLGGYALVSDSVDLNRYVGKDISLLGTKVEGYPIDAGPIYLNVHKVVTSEQFAESPDVFETPQDIVDLLINDIWVVKSIQGQAIEKTSSPVILEIALQQMKIFGNDGCNRFTGSIETATATLLELSGISATKMACPDMSIPIAFQQRLTDTRSYERKQLTLYLRDQSGEILLTLSKGD
jgi:heat shock protein HslJ